jgi:hypothetical protein
MNYFVIYIIYIYYVASLINFNLILNLFYVMYLEILRNCTKSIKALLT